MFRAWIPYLRHRMTNREVAERTGGCWSTPQSVAMWGGCSLAQGLRPSPQQTELPFPCEEDFKGCEEADYPPTALIRNPFKPVLFPPVDLLATVRQVPRGPRCCCTSTGCTSFSQGGQKGLFFKKNNWCRFQAKKNRPGQHLTSLMSLITRMELC